MSTSTRSKRQLAGLRRMRDWHLKNAIRAHMEGKKQEANLHFFLYDLLGPAVGQPNKAQ